MSRSAVIEYLRAHWVVLAIALAGSAVMLAFAGQYGMHRDEMYFVMAGRHPDFGYMDQPPLTPLLSALEVQLFGVSAFALRIAATITYAVVVLLAAFIARGFGGGRGAEIVAALTVAVSGWMVAAHLDSTETYDILGWTIFLAILVRVLNGGDRRLWLLAGLVAGICLENKALILFLAVGLAAGVLITRRWDLLRNRWVWAGLAIAFLIWLPNFVWQAANGWPQLEMSRMIAERDGDQNRSDLILIQILLAGPLLFPVFVAGLWWLLRAQESKPWRMIGWSYLVVMAVLFITKGKSYYAAGLMPTMIAAGAVVTARWLSRSGVWARRAKRGTYGVATVASGLIIVAIAMPITPEADFPKSDLARSGIATEMASTYGWPSFVAQVREVADSLRADERAHAFIFTGNYGEAGSLQLLGPGNLPPVYSGHNSYWTWGPPDETRTIAIVVDGWDGAGSYFSSYFGPCTLAANIDLGFPNNDVDEEQGAGIWVCRSRTRPWSEIWPELRHYS